MTDATAETASTRRAISAGPAAGRPRTRILAVGFGEPELQALGDALGAEYELASPPPAVDPAGPELGAWLDDAAGAAVVCLGPEVPPEAARRLVAGGGGGDGPGRPLHLVLAAGPDLDAFQEEVDRIFFLCRHPPPAGELARLVAGAAREHRRRSGVGEAAKRTGGAWLRLAAPAVREVLDRLPLQTEAAELAELLVQAALEAALGDRARCLLHDPADGTLWSPEPGGGERRESAAVGLASFVLRSGAPVRLARAAADPRHDPPADDPEGDGDERFLAVPLTAPGGEVLGVLTAVRGAAREPFDDRDAAALEALARHGAALLAVLHPASVVPAPRTAAARTGPRGPEGAADAPASHRLFRPEALASWRGTANEHGNPLELSSGWLRWGFRLLVAGLVAGCVVLATAEVADRVPAPAVVRAPGGGAPPHVEAVVPVGPGAPVRPGMEGVLHLDGFPDLEVPIEVRSVRELAGSGDPGGPRLTVEASLPGTSFSAGDGEREPRDGMRGRVEIVRGREPLVFTLMPGLRSLRDGGGGGG